jgi:hypothetical protein
MDKVQTTIGSQERENSDNIKGRYIYIAVSVERKFFFVVIFCIKANFKSLDI